MTSTPRSADMASKVGVSANYKAVFLYAFRQGYENEVNTKYNHDYFFTAFHLKWADQTSPYV